MQLVARKCIENEKYNVQKIMHILQTPTEFDLFDLSFLLKKNIAKYAKSYYFISSIFTEI